MTRKEAERLAVAIDTLIIARIGECAAAMGDDAEYRKHRNDFAGEVFGELVEALEKLEGS